MEKLFEHIKLREGYKQNVYLDILGKATCGIGHLLTEEEHQQYPVKCLVPQQVIDNWFKKDTKKAISGAEKQMNDLELINEDDISKISTIGANAKIQIHAKLKPIQADTEITFNPKITHTFREQNIDVFFQEYKNIANENIINRYVPTTFLGIIFVLATIIIAQRNLKK